MRKYHQLLLFIVSILSLTLLLFYRNEYMKLHNVLEVFNFFGTPCNFTDVIETNHMLNNHDWGREPVWRQEDNSYFYSGFWLHKEAKVIVIQNRKAVFPKNCYLWYENQNEPVIGKFRYSKITDNKAYYYYCSVPVHDVPYAVSFHKDLGKVLLTIPLKKISFNTTLCIIPSPKITKRSLFEFLSYHNLVGVDSFIVYTNNISHKLVKVLSNLSSRLGFKITFFPWNYLEMENELFRSIVENDCILRSLNQSKSAFVLNIDEYLVPSVSYTIKEVFEDNVDETLRIAVQNFCIENVNLNKPIPLQNTVISYDTNNIVRVIYRNIYETRRIDVHSNSISIHKYIHCENVPEKTYIDNTMLKFSTDFIRSTLIQLLLNKEL